MRNFAAIAALAFVMNTSAGCGNDEYIDAMSSDEINVYAESYGADDTTGNSKTTTTASALRKKLTVHLRTNVKCFTAEGGLGWTCQK